MRGGIPACWPPSSMAGRSPPWACTNPRAPNSPSRPSIRWSWLRRCSARSRWLANRYLLIGGHTELVAGYTVSRALPAPDRDRVAGTLVAAAFELAGERGLIGASLYVGDRQLAAFRGTGLATCQVGQRLALTVPAGGEPAYLAGLKHSHRSVVRREQRFLDEHGLRGVEGSVFEIVDEAIPLIMAVKRRHGLSDHPALSRLRLTSWARSPAGEPVAFWVRDRGGTLLAVSLGRRYDSTLELYEIGLTEDPRLRHPVYAEVLVYAPLRHAARTGCTSIQLGFGSATPKMLRGAYPTPVWAVGAGPTEGAVDDRT